MSVAAESWKAGNALCAKRGALAFFKMNPYRPPGHPELRPQKLARHNLPHLTGPSAGGSQRYKRKRKEALMPKGVKPDDPDYRKRPKSVGRGIYVSLNPRGRAKGKQRLTLFKETLGLLAEMAGQEPTHIKITPAPRANLYIEPASESTEGATSLFRHHKWGYPATCHFPAKLLDHVEAEEETLLGAVIREENNRIRVIF